MASAAQSHSITKGSDSYRGSLSRSIQGGSDTIASTMASAAQSRSITKGSESYRGSLSRSIQGGSDTIASQSRASGSTSIRQSSDEIADAEQVSSVTLYCDVNTRIACDKNTCDITGICQLPNGHLVLADNSNNKLKLSDANYVVMDAIELSSAPWAVCMLGCQKEVAVSMPTAKHIQLLRFEPKLALTRSFKIDLTCRGVAFHAGKLYVACGDSYFGNDVRSFDMYGNLINSFPKPVDSQIISWPYHVAVSNDGNDIYVADGNNGLVTMATNGQTITQFNDATLQNAISVCTDKDKVYVCGYKSCNVVQISRDGTNFGEMLTKSNGIFYPQALCFDRMNSRLVVALGNEDKMKVFNIM